MHTFPMLSASRTSHERADIGSTPTALPAIQSCHSFLQRHILMLQSSMMMEMKSLSLLVIRVSCWNPIPAHLLVQPTCITKVFAVSSYCGGFHLSVHFQSQEA